MRTLQYGIVTLMGLALAGCVTTVSDQRVTPSQQRPAAAAAQVPLSGLDAQALELNECGLFLWSKTDTTKFIFFSKAMSGQAVFKPDDETLQLEQVAAGGTIFGQFNTEQGYRASDGRVIELAFEAGEPLIDGQRISDGLITVTDAEGWRTVLPVLGIRACVSGE